ncbi:hypothetical protein H0H92_003753 [Tricholoma furcatifolium]|nr:hypothetical protein H0H92_003753 [Tricholoma furcatifolium]
MKGQYYVQGQIRSVESFNAPVISAVRCDGVQMPGLQCTNCTDYGLDCTYVETAKKRGPPKAYIDRLENRVKNLREIISKISPEALEQLKHSPGPNVPNVGLQPPTRTPPTAELPSQGPNQPRHFIRHLGSTTSPPPGPDEDMSYLFEDPDLVQEEPRYFGIPNASMLLRLSMKLKRMCVGEDAPGMLEEPVSRPWVDPIPDPVPDISAYIFPESDLLASLIDLYFQHVNLYFPLLHRPTFERLVSSGLHRTDIAFATMLLMLCAVAARYSDDPRVMTEPKDPSEQPDPHSSGWKWFNQVPLMRTTLLKPTSLYDLQFYVLLAQFMQATSVPQACWTVTGIGLRLAQDVGAHRRKRRKIHTVEDELWSRAVYVLVCVDRLFCSSLGRPCAMQDEDFDLPMPKECDDEYWEHPDSNQRWRQPTPQKTPSVIAYFNAYIRLNQILAFLLRTVYATHPSRVLHGFVGPGWEADIVSELDSALQAWMANLPDHLRWDPSRSNEVFFNQSVSLFCLYQHIQILVHRPFIPNPRKTNQPFPFPSLAICTNAARACSNALDIQRRRSKIAPPPLTTTAFTSGVVLLLSIWGKRRSGMSMDFDVEMKGVKKCMDLLNVVENSDILRELAHVGDLQLPKKGSNSPPVSQKRRKGDEESGSELAITPTEPEPRTGGRHRKQELYPQSAMTRRRSGVPPLQHSQLHTMHDYDFDYPRPSQQQQQLRQPSLPHPHYWPRQETLPPPPKPFEPYHHRPDVQTPAGGLPTFGQTFGPAFDQAQYVDDPGTYAYPRTSEMVGPGVRPVYHYRTASDPTMSMNLDMDVRPRTSGDVEMTSSLNPNVNETFTLWSNAPPNFQMDEWGNYVSHLHGPGPSGQGHFAHHG